MGKILFFITCLILGLSSAYGQDGGKSIVEEINSTKPNQGNVRVLQDESIDRLVGVRKTSTSSPTSAYSSDHIKVRGWKIQVFSGNNQQKSKAEAEQKQSLVKNAFPELETTVSYSAPIWRLRVGNFLNREVAEETLTAMKEVLPSFAKEMYLVQEVIELPVE